MDRLQDHFLTPSERSGLEALLRERKAAGLRIRRAMHFCCWMTGLLRSMSRAFSILMKKRSGSGSAASTVRKTRNPNFQLSSL